MKFVNTIKKIIIYTIATLICGIGELFRDGIRNRYLKRTYLATTSFVYDYKNYKYRIGIRNFDVIFLIISASLVLFYLLYNKKTFETADYKISINIIVTAIILGIITSFKIEKKPK
jgi:hypothetical protein